MTKREVVPAIIPESFDDLVKNLEKVKGLAPLVQIDIIDGVFAPPKTWPYTEGDEKEISLPLKESFDFSIDMMVNEPEDVIDKWMDAGAGALIIHFESTKALDDIISRIKIRGVRAGLAFNPSTPNAHIYEWVEKVDFIQVMGNDGIGYHGVQLDEKVYEKVRDLREKYPNITIGVDIGVNFDTAEKLIDSGVNKLVSGSAIFESRSPEEAIKRFQNI